MTFSLLYFGDIVGEPGRQAIAELLPGLREEFKPDLILANSENATHGKGMNKRHYEYLSSLGIDGFSGGDHSWQGESVLFEPDADKLWIARPANYPKAPGQRYLDFTVKGKRVRLINLQGRAFMSSNIDSPFQVFDQLAALQPLPDAIIVDMHAEATSEKRCLAEYIDGRAQLVVGTHTHVPTADAQILPQGTGFITDLGMVGPQDSSLGAEKSEPIKNFLTGLPWAYSVSAGQCELGAVFATIDFDAKKATHLEHLRRFTSNV